jgi:hypothetical protein
MGQNVVLMLAFAQVIKHRHGHAREKRGSHFTGHERDGQTLKYRVKQNHACAHHYRGRRQQHGTETYGARIHDGVDERNWLDL